jgi:rare lipoprotein A
MNSTLERWLLRGDVHCHCRPAPPGHAATSNRAAALLLPLLLAALLCACSSIRPALRPSGGEIGTARQRGVASWYGPGFNGRRTANGERYDMHELTAAHPSLPFGTLVEVRNLSNARAVVVRINDRGPFAKRRIIDLSYAAARSIGVYGPGTAEVELRVVDRYLLDSRYTVQVAAFGDPDRAVALHRDMIKVFPETFVHSDGTWHRVQIGLFKDRDHAESLRRELAAMGVCAYVVATR